MRYESSTSDESIGTMTVQYRIAAERDKRQKDMEANWNLSSKQHWQEEAPTPIQAGYKK